MNTHTPLHNTPAKFHRDHERGAALITTLLIATLLLIVGGALILRTSTSAINAIDSTAETQAYYAAEAGMQATLNVLRGNAVGEKAGDKVSFKEAAVPVTSNTGGKGDPSTVAGLARLSKWLDYSYQGNTVNGRVPLTMPYSPLNGLAYSVVISAPDTGTLGTPPKAPPGRGDDGWNKPTDILVKPTPPPWHTYHCAHCSWRYEHCRFKADPTDPTGVRRVLKQEAIDNPEAYCTHTHCDPPDGGNAGTPGDDGYQRLLVRVTGYGPKGARKEIEMLVKRLSFDYDPPTPVYLQGKPGGGGMTFNVGISAVTVITGKDLGGGKRGTEFPAIGFTEQTDYNEQKIKFETNTAVKDGDPEALAEKEKAPWLASATAARALVADLKNAAEAQSRYFTTNPTGNFGTAADPKFTFVDGPATLKGNGAGLLVVTGKLTLNGGFDFDGLILVLGDGDLYRDGVGNGKIEGGIVVAKFDLADPTGGFLAPTFNTNGGGNATIQMNTLKIEDALELMGRRVLAVREY